jgi:hypothetical protein
MPRTCTVCVHPQRRKIDSWLLKQKPLRDIAERFALSKTSLGRHAEGHIAADLAGAKRRADADAADRLAELLEEVERDTRVIKNLNMPSHDADGEPVKLVWQSSNPAARTRFHSNEPPSEEPHPGPIANPDSRLALAALDRLTRIAALRARIQEGQEEPEDQDSHRDAIGFTGPPTDPPGEDGKAQTKPKTPRAPV